MLKKGISEESEYHYKTYSNDEMDAIFSTLKVNLNDKQIAEISKKLNRAKIVFQSSEYFFRDPMPSIETLKKEDLAAFDRMKKGTQRLLIDLKEHKHRLVCSIAPLEDRINEMERISKRIDKIVAELNDLSIHIQEAIAKKKIIAKKQAASAGHPQRTTNSKKQYRGEFVKHLLEIYESTTGKKARTPGHYEQKNISGQQFTKFNNPTLRFIKACIKPITPDITDVNLKNMIERALKR